MSDRRFATTHWSLVLEAGGSSSDAASALTELCERYWLPIYAFICRTGEPPEEARDLTQAFFARLVEKSVLSAAQPDRGRFRAFLLTSVRHFLSNERDARRTIKRGGLVRFVPLDVSEGDQRLAIDPPDDLTPERIYERRWTLTVLDAAMKRVETRYASSGRLAIFAALTPTLTGTDTPGHADVARQLGMTEGAVRVAAHRLKKEFATALRDTVRETVADPADVDDELRFLLKAL